MKRTDKQLTKKDAMKLANVSGYWNNWEVLSEDKPKFNLICPEGFKMTILKRGLEVVECNTLFDPLAYVNKAKELGYYE